MMKNTLASEIGRRAPITIRLLASTFLTGVVVQVYLAGLAFFSTGTFGAHQVVGWGLILVAAALLIVIVVSWRTKRNVVMAAAILFCTVLQPVLALGVRTTLPWLAAMHTVNALAIFWLSIALWKKAGMHRMPRPSLKGTTVTVLDQP